MSDTKPVEAPKPVGSMRPTIGAVEVAWVPEVRAPLWSRYGPNDPDTEEIVVAWAERAGAAKVRACWTGGMFRVERA